MDLVADKTAKMGRRAIFRWRKAGEKRDGTKSQPPRQMFGARHERWRGDLFVGHLGFKKGKDTLSRKQRIQEKRKGKGGGKLLMYRDEWESEEFLIRDESVR